MRIPVVAANFKMNTTVAEAFELVTSMKKRLNRLSGVERVLCPPFISLVPVKEVIKGTSIKLGAQNMFYERSGAFTGEISPVMLAQICDYVILGHSERRARFGDTDEIVNKKLKAALAFGLAPIVCVGETLEQNEGGETIEVINRQVKAAFDGIDAFRDTVIAYEPIWAIGTGKAARGDQANAVIRVIRGALSKLYGDDAGQTVRIQYGGSVTASNIAEFISQPDVDGALVGGASLKAEEFLSIVEQTAKIKST
ncbi:MAG: triose-phosphate isomerase [Dehalococcoidia bacterium]|nr:triose-phosphate isomerase [Dehalococcoidia bacterium]